MAGDTASSLVKVNIQTLAGNGLEVELPSNATVRQAKEEVERRMGVKIIEQRLVYAGNVLDDNLRPFEEIAKGASVLTLVRVPFASLKQLMADEVGLPLSTKDVDNLTASDLCTLFKKAAETDQPNVCLEAMSHSAWSADGQKGLLRVVAVGGMAEVFEELVSRDDFGGQPGVLNDEFIALHIAAKRGLTLHCQALLRSPQFTEAAARSERTGATALHHAANEAVLRILLSCSALRDEAAINAQDRQGCTCLHYASTEGACKAIIEQPTFKALDRADAYGQTALHCARVPGMCHAIIHHPLLTAINARDNTGACPLHYLVRTDAALPLLEARAAVLTGADPSTIPPAARLLDVDVVDGRGRTALFFVHTPEVCRALFAAGFAQPCARDNVGRSAVQECRNADVLREIVAHPFFEVDGNSNMALSDALAVGNKEVADLLRAAGARPSGGEDEPVAVEPLGRTEEDSLVEIVTGFPGRACQLARSSCSIL